ncbi:hypothetical protein D3C79_976900 [compost metagenome]
MNVAAPQKHLTPGDHDHFVFREHSRQNRSSFSICRVVEAWRDDAAIDDQEVDVGAGQAHRRVALLAAGHRIDPGALFFSGEQRPRNRHLVHGKGATFGVTAVLQHLERGVAARVVGVLRIIGPGQ